MRDGTTGLFTALNIVTARRCIIPEGPVPVRVCWRTSSGATCKHRGPEIRVVFDNFVDAHVQPVRKRLAKPAQKR